MSGNVIRIESLGKENYDTWKLQMDGSSHKERNVGICKWVYSKIK
jgi:hypothetical protein